MFLEGRHALLQLEDSLVLLRPVLLELADEVCADVRALGEDPPAHAEEEGHDRGAGAEAREGHGVPDEEPHACHAAQAQRRGQEAADGPRADAYLQGVEELVAQRMRKARLAVNRHADTGACTDEIEDGTRAEAHKSLPASSHTHIPSSKEQDEENRGNYEPQVRLDAFSYDSANVHDSLGAYVLKEHEGREVTHSEEPQ
mmetsp:Transcript_95650/g.297282  ORF Transcript_95650/g.297282 Transcript_95650/m.297282 type:complete len:200 (+) Transcript_95650:1756-2355(+)